MKVDLASPKKGLRSASISSVQPATSPRRVVSPIKQPTEEDRLNAQL
jgi:hypothetical protein